MILRMHNFLLFRSNIHNTKPTVQTKHSLTESKQRLTCMWFINCNRQ